MQDPNEIDGHVHLCLLWEKPANLKALLCTVEDPKQFACATRGGKHLRQRVLGKRGRPSNSNIHSTQAHPLTKKRPDLISLPHING